MASQMMAGGMPGAPGAAPGGDGAANPFAALFGPGGGFGGAGGFGGGAGGFGAPAPAAPADTRPPEEVYESQLRQLNEMGFFEFERNVSALRRSGGNVQGAIEYLLNGA
jgi:ubiquilin